MRIIAIDPGLTGALAVLDTDRAVVDLDDLPVIRDGHYAWVDGGKLMTKLIEVRAGRHDLTVVVEQISPNPKNGMVVVKGQMMAMGSILATAQIAGARIEFVPPITWKNAMGLINRRGVKLTPTQVKHQSLDKARLLFPHAELPLAKHHNRAEALLLADWYLQERIGRTKQEIA